MTQQSFSFTFDPSDRKAYKFTFDPSERKVTSYRLDPYELRQAIRSMTKAAIKQNENIWREMQRRIVCGITGRLD